MKVLNILVISVTINSKERANFVSIENLSMEVQVADTSVTSVIKKLRKTAIKFHNLEVHEVRRYSCYHVTLKQKFKSHQRWSP